MFISEFMRKFVKVIITLAYLTCTGHARRLQTSTLRFGDKASLRQPLLAFNPTGVVNPSDPGTLRAQKHEVSTVTGLPPAGLLYGARTPVVRMDETSGPDPEDWRAFRAKLISSWASEENGDNNATAEEQSSVERKSVALENEELLKGQNKDLWEEYFQGAWAHEISVPEVGGVLCRLSNEAQLLRQMRSDPNSSRLAQQLYERLCSQLPSGLDEDATSNSSAQGGGDNAEFERLFALWSSNTMYMYRMAEGLLKEYMVTLREKAVGNRVELDKQSDDLQEFIIMMLMSDKQWQQVALVLETGAGSLATESTKCLVLNRPLAKSMREDLAELLLNGVTSKEALLKGRTTKYDDDFIDRCVEAFGEEAAVYLGGPDGYDQGEVGTLIHGFALPGATEIAPGTRIYSGGVEAAIDAVLAGERSPLDFRWFLGHTARASTAKNQWCSIACARPIALKQCLGLPKPLWHEVLELCGGDLEAFSRVEILKRDDLDMDMD